MITIFSLTIVVFLIMLPSSVFGETPLFEVPESPKEPLIPGRIEGAGTYFQIEDSEYLNITLQSTEEIKVILESIPRMISLDIEAGSESIDSAELTIEGLEPNKTYYKYQNSYKNEAVFISDENGSYSWQQDLTQPHHIWFQEIKGTTYIDQDTVLDHDMIGSVEITADNITLDCNGHKIIGNDTGYGIYSNRRENVTIKNCAVSKFSYGIYLYRSNSNLLTGNIITLNKVGVWGGWSSKSSVVGNDITNNSHGILLAYTSEDIISENIITHNRNQAIALSDLSNSKVFRNTIINNDGNGLSIFSRSYNNIIFENNITDNGSRGFSLSEAYNNTIYGNNIIRNFGGIHMQFSPDNNVIYHNNFINNQTQVIIYQSSSQIFDNDYPEGGNYWSDYIGVDSDGDRIGDTPYTFEGGQDRYPFMIESGWEAPPPEEDEEWSFNVAVILAETSDVPHESSSITAQPCKLRLKKTYPQGRNKKYFEDLLYCVTDYHKENSFDKVNLNFEIYDNDGEWFRTDKKEEDYLDKEREFVKDAMSLVQSTGIDLSDKDIVIVLHSGTSSQRSKDKLSTQTWALLNHPLGYPPYKIIVAEDDLVGGWSHEVGHILGALITPENTIIPDLSNEKLLMGFVEKWDLMGRGSWNGGWLNIDSTNPPYMSSYTKEFLGWLNYDIYPKSAYGEYWINSLETSEFGDSIFRYNLTDDTQDESQKYYILETRNRNLKTWDSSLPGLPVISDKNLVLYYVDTKGFPEYGYVPAGIEEYQEGIMWNQYRTVTIPGNDPKNSEINDGILNHLINETYRDLDNLVKFSAITDRTVNDKYEIQAKIEEITYDSFDDKFWGAVLRPKSTFKKWIEEVFNPSFANNSELYKFEENFVEAQLAVAYFNPETGKWEGGAPMKPSLLKELIYKIKGFSFYALIFLVMLSILSGLVRFIARWLSERKRKTIKNISRIIWITTLIIFIIFIIFSLITRYWESKKPVTENLENFKTIANPSQKESGILPDLDLHLYCDDDRHIGMNYETGEYEVQIPEAIVSGNNQDAPEWIFIPESIDNCNYFVSSYSNQKFLEENPEIAQAMEDTTDSYEIYARYIDNETGIYTSAIISENIAPGIELKHPISGTDDIEIEQGILINPRTITQETLSELEAAKIGDSSIDAEIDLIIQSIERSLTDNYWLDSSHLDSNYGRRVFSYQKKAVKRMEKDLLRQDISEKLKEVFRRVIKKLTKADEILAVIALEETKDTPIQNPRYQRLIQRYLSLAEEQLAKAYQQLAQDKPEEAIDNFRRSWDYSQRAISYANR